MIIKLTAIKLQGFKHVTWVFTKHFDPHLAIQTAITLQPRHFKLQTRFCWDRQSQDLRIDRFFGVQKAMVGGLKR